MLVRLAILRPERAPWKCWTDASSMYNYYVTHVSSWSLWQRGMGFCCRKHFAHTGFYDILVCDSFMHLFARHMCSWLCFHCLHADSHAAEARPLRPLRPEHDSLGCIETDSNCVSFADVRRHLCVTCVCVCVSVSEMRL